VTVVTFIVKKQIFNTDTLICTQPFEKRHFRFSLEPKILFPLQYVAVFTRFRFCKIAV